MRDRSLLWRIAPFLAATLVLATSACPSGGRTQGNIVLITIESLRSDRLTGKVPSPDPFENLRALAGPNGATSVLASSTDSLPSLASIMTGVGPQRHGTLIDGLDRLPSDLPTLAARLVGAGYRTAGFPSMAALGLTSGLSRGFQTYGWSPGDLVSQAPLAQTDRAGWMIDSGRRPGQATVGDALKWAGAHRSDPMFVWIHLSESVPPYATDRALVETFRGSMYDASMAYDDRCVKAAIDGFAQLGLSSRTTFIVAGDHGESLGEHGESFHGQNLYRPALETAIVVIAPESARSGETAASSAAGRPAAGSSGNASASPGRLQDLYPMILGLAGIAPPGGARGETGSSSPAAGRPVPVSADHPLLAVTLAPRSAFGWNGRLALFDGQWIWSGPSDEELYLYSEGSEAAGSRIAAEPARSREMRERAMREASTITVRLPGRQVVPGPAERKNVLDLMRTAVAARDKSDRVGETAALQRAWQIDPGNFETALWLAQSNGPKATADNAVLLREVRTRGGSLPEAALAASRIVGVTPALGDPLEIMKTACAAGSAGCGVDLALRFARAGKYEQAAQTLAPIAETGADPDLWRTLGDMYLAVENTYRAQQAFEKAASLKPNDPDVLLRQGDCYVALRDFKSAAAKYEAARAAVPGLALVEMRLGMMARQQGDRVTAVEHFRKGLNVDTNTAAGEIALGQVLVEQGMAEEAIPLFHDAASRDTASSDGLYHAAEALAAEGRLDEAEKDLRSALDRSPNNATILYQLARLLVYRGDRAGGGQLLEKLSSYASTDIAVAALRDPLFANEAPGSPLAKGLQDLYALVKRSVPEGSAIVVPPSAPPASPGAAQPPARP